MRNQAERTFRVDLRHVDGYRFESRASEDGRPHGDPFASDEPDPIGSASAPATPALLGAAVGHCLAASLLETLRHAHVAVSDCTTEVITVVRPNADGLPRIDHVDVVLKPVIHGDGARTRRCEEVFERHCTVTSSVREGVDVRVAVDWSGVSRDEVRQPERIEAVAAPGTG
jgi:organic hydroperoxide reductase OsmC/OhrA